MALADPDWRAVIYRRSDGLFFYVRERFWDLAYDPDFDWGPHSGWQPDSQSGIFATAELAEAEIRRNST